MKKIFILSMIIVISFVFSGCDDAKKKADNIDENVEAILKIKEAEQEEYQKAVKKHKSMTERQGFPAFGVKKSTEEAKNKKELE